MSGLEFWGDQVYRHLMARNTACMYALAAIFLGATLATFRTSLAIEERVEFGVWARCPPHAQITVPQQVQIRVAFSSTSAGPSATGWMSAVGESRFDATTQNVAWQVPEKGWVSFIFEGPPVSGMFYCQDDWGNKPLHLSYVPHTKIKAFLSRDGLSSGTELDHAIEATRTTLDVPLTPGTTVYRAGSGSTTPYWLQIAIPVYDVQSAATTLSTRFQ